MHGGLWAADQALATTDQALATTHQLVAMGDDHEFEAPTETSPLTPQAKNLDSPTYGATDPAPAESEARESVSTWMAAVLITKSMIGAGWLSMPKAFNESGILLGVILELLVGWLTMIGLRVVTDAYLECVSKEEEEEEEEDSQPITLQRLVQNHLGLKGASVLTAMMVLSQFGVGIGYSIYLGDFLYALCDLPQWAGSLIASPICTCRLSIRYLIQSKLATSSM